MVFTSKSLAKLTTVNSKSIAIMKNLFTRLMLVAVAAMGIVACQTEPEIYVPENNADAVSVSITAGFEDTRSAFDELADGATTYTSSWTANETVRFSLNQTGFVDMENTSEGKSATFNVSFTEGIQDAGSIYAFSPKGNYSSTPKVGGFTGSMAQTYTSVYVVVPSEQTPQTNSCDEGVHLLTAKYDYEGGVPTTIDNMPFKHLLAYGKMAIKGFEGTIKSVKLTADTPLSGNSVKYFFTVGEPYIEGADNNSLVLDATNVENNVFWFGCIPADLSNSTLTVVITDDQDNTYTKAISIPADSLEFVQGQVSSFSVNFTGSSADVVEPTVDPSTLAYQLVTNVVQLYDGAYVIVASGNSGSVAVMGATNSNGNNRPQAAGSHSVSDDVLYYTDAAILRLGVDGANYTLYDINEGGYLYAASSSSNHLKTSSTIDDNGKWSIEIGGEPYSATVKSTGLNTRNWMRYNQSSEMFSCYASGQSDIYLYVGVDPSTVVTKQALDAPENVAAVADGKTITVTWDAVEYADNYTVTCGDSQEVTISSNEVLKAEFTVSEYATEYEVSVVANPADNSESYISSAKRTVSVITGADPRKPLATPVLKEGVVTDISITVSWEAVDYATSYDVYLGDTLKGDNILETSYTFNDLESGNEYSISVVANGDAEFYLPSEAGVITVSTTGQATSATLSFASTDQRTSFSTTQQVWKQNGITFTNNKASSTNNVADYADPVRLYKNSTITVAHANNISKIEFTCSSSSYATALGGSISSSTVSGSVVTVVLDGTSNSFTATLSGGQVRMNSLTVYF